MSKNILRIPINWAQTPRVKKKRKVKKKITIFWAITCEKLYFFIKNPTCTVSYVCLSIIFDQFLEFGLTVRWAHLSHTSHFLPVTAQSKKRANQRPRERMWLQSAIHMCWQMESVIYCSCEMFVCIEVLFPLVIMLYVRLFF